MNGLQAVSLYGTRNPFESALARANSNYSAFVDGELVRLLDWKRPSARARLANDAFRAFAGHAQYPCLGAKAALNGGHYRIAAYGQLTSESATAGLARDLCAFVAESPLMETGYATFVAVFDDIALTGEGAFERGMWQQLQMLHDLDVRHFEYAPGASSDPNDPRFTFSFAAKAFFVVGMHPGSSRIARRFPFPALAFNAHTQFQALRAKQLYDRFCTKIRDRELALQGSLNPNLSEFGEQSEARQYSGRQVEESWECPFRP
jgi:FPC/CPF motif-containing protein YcgG